MENITIKKLDIYSYLQYENKAFIAILIFGIAFLVYILSEYLLYFIFFLVVLIAIRYYLLNKKYTKYSIIGTDKSYFLFSKLLGSKLNNSTGQYSDVSVSNENYLEDLLSDIYNRGDWDNLNKVDSYKQILSLVQYAHVPSSDNNQFTLPQMNEEVKSTYNSLIENLNHTDKTKENVGELYSTLSSIYSKRSTFNMQKSISNLENLL